MRAVRCTHIGYIVLQVMRALGQDPTEDELEAMVEDVDEDGSGSIEVDEFIKMMAKRSKGQ